MKRNPSAGIRFLFTAGAAILCVLCLQAATAQAQAWTPDVKATSGRLIVERPTLLSLGFEWMINGDSNNNAKVDVEYRKVGDAQWRKAMPMFRLHNPVTPAGTIKNAAEAGRAAADADSSAAPEGGGGTAPYMVPNAFASSVLNLEPDTEYETRFTLSDPDGVKGKTVQIAKIRTRREPMPAAGGHVYHVYPANYKGTRQEPSFFGLLRAYYMNTSNGDTNNSYPIRVQPGDTILVHAGVYKDIHRHYGEGLDNNELYGLEFDGTYYLRASGTPDKPIVIKGAGDGEAIFDGAGAAVLFDLTIANYTYFEDLTFRNADVAFLTGRKEALGSSGLTLKHCKIEDIGRGVWGEWAGSKDFYIADNVFVGRHNPNILLSWYPGELWTKLPGFPNPISGPGGSELAVKVYGQGHVVAYNRVSGFHDGIDHGTYGPPDGAPDHVIEENVPGSVDYYGNDMFNLDDNCFEVDGGARNMRIFRNRCFNSGQEGFSFAPSYGGPWYIYQNLAYNNIQGSLKGGWGTLMYQNTIQGEVHPQNGGPANSQFRNNLILAVGVYPEVIGALTDEYSSSDHNGFLLNPGAQTNFLWVDIAKEKIPRPLRRLSSPTAPLRPATVPGFGYKTLDEYCKGSGQDCHSILIDYSDFVKASGTKRSDPTILYKPEDYDFRLKPDSKAVDAGVVLPNINDGFTGKAPDLGVYELGKPIPHYGPRTAGAPGADNGN